MMTFWLVVLLIGLLIFDFSKHLLRSGVAPWQLAWTGSDSLLALSSATSIFCLGLAWRYYSGSLDGEINLQRDWLPYVIVVLALCLISGFIQSWRDAEDVSETIEDPYHLLETSLPLTEAPLFQSKQSRKLAVRGTTLALSILVGFVGAALLLQLNVTGDTIETGNEAFFAQNRIRPTPLPTRPLYLLIPGQQPPAISPAIADTAAGTTTGATTRAETSTNSKPAPSEPLITTVNRGAADDPQGQPQNQDPLYAARGNIGATVPSIGGPLGETPLDAITTAASVSSQAHGEGVDLVVPEPENYVSIYTAVVRATLGVKARQQPSASGNILELLKYGNQYQVMGRTPNGAWIQIVLENGDLAWIIAAAIDGTLFDTNQQVVSLDDLPLRSSY